MATKKILSQLDILIESTLQDATSGFVTFGAKSTGLYQKIGSTETKLVVSTDLIPVTSGGTGKTSVSLDSMLYASSANTYAEVTTTSFGRGLLASTSGTMVTGLNAEKLGGLISDYYVQGGTIARVTNINDLTTVWKSGFYQGYQVTGAPSTLGDSYFIRTAYYNASGSYGVGFNIAYSGNKVSWGISGTNGVIATWIPFYDSTNVNKTTVAWNASSLTLNGAISGATTITASSNINAVGLSTSWGSTSGISTGGLNVVMGTSSSATWLISGTSGGTFRGGIQLLDSGTQVRFYVGANLGLSILDTGVVGLQAANGIAPLTTNSTTKVTNLNVDAVDGYHFNQSLQTTDNPNFNTVTSANITGIRGSVPNNTVITTDNAQIIQGPIAKYLWHDLFSFSKVATPNFDTSTDLISWTSSTLYTDHFSQKDYVGSIVLSPTIYGARWTWYSPSFSYSNGFWLVLGIAYSALPANRTVLFESSADGTTWTTRHTSTSNVTAQPIWHYLNGGYGGDAYLRLTITKLTSETTTSLNLGAIRLLSNRWGDQGNGNELEFPYTWDGAQKMTVKGFNIQSVTASQYLEVDASKNVISVAKGTAFNLALSTTTPLMDGTANYGSSTTQLARADHVHPTDTTRQAVLTNPVTGTGTNGYIAMFSGTSTIQSSILNYDGNSLFVNLFHMPYNTTVSDYISLSANNNVISSGGGSIGNIKGFQSSISASNTSGVQTFVEVNNMKLASCSVDNSGTSLTINRITNLRIDALSIGGTNVSVTDAYSIYSKASYVGTGATVTNYYDLFLGGVTVDGTVTNKYGIYQDDTSSTNILRSKLLIGTTTYDGSSLLQVNGTVGLLEHYPTLNLSVGNGWVDAISTINFLDDGSLCSYIRNDNELGEFKFYSIQPINFYYGTTETLSIDNSGVTLWKLNVAGSWGNLTITQGTGDGATYATYNHVISGWNGLALANPTSGGTYPNQNVGMIDFRGGIITMKGGFTTTGVFTGSGANLTSIPYSALTGTVPTWNQNTTGSAATLTTTRTIWGQNFNGSANVTGALTGVTTISMNSTLTGGTTASFSSTITASNFILSSDRKFKTNIKNIDNSLLDVVYKEFELKTELGEKRYGVIAQELQEIAPELVCNNKDGLSVKYIDLLIREIAYLKNELRILKNK